MSSQPSDLAISASLAFWSGEGELGGAFVNGGELSPTDSGTTVREVVSATFGDAIQFTPILGQGTRIEAMSSVDEEAFQVVTRAAIAVAQAKNATQSQ